MKVDESTLLDERPAGTRLQRTGGVDYVYVDHPFWDRERKRGDHRREYVGKMTADGRFAPNAAWLLRVRDGRRPGPGPRPVASCSRLFAGATYLLAGIARQRGMDSDLRAVAGADADLILSLAFQQVLEARPVYLFRKWGVTHEHPAGGDIASQRVSELFARIGADEHLVKEYYRLQAARLGSGEFLAMDTTSISSTSQLAKLVKWGRNKDHDPLPQVNLLTLVGQESMIPVYQRLLPGNIPDVSTLEHLLRDVAWLGIDHLALVMDRGFYSGRNINDLISHHHEFLIAAGLGLTLVRDHVDADRGHIMDRANWDAQSGLYTRTHTITWRHTLPRPRKGDTLVTGKRCYLHVCYNPQRATDEQARLNHRLDQWEHELKTGKPADAHEPQYATYFHVRRTPKRPVRVTPNQDAIDKAMNQCGWFALLANHIKYPRQAIRVYRQRDTVEKTYTDLKDRLDTDRTRCHSDTNLTGKLFVQFIALQLISYIKHHMNQAGLTNNWSMASLLDELDIIEHCQQPGRQPYWTPITTKQHHLYQAMNIPPPNQT